MLRIVESFLKEKTINYITSINVYDETDYEQLTKRIEEKISRINENDRSFENLVKEQLRTRENECNRKKE